MSENPIKIDGLEVPPFQETPNDVAILYISDLNCV